MLVQIGRRSEPGDAIDMLVACHGRIRHFLWVARRLESVETSAADVIDSAHAVARYFEEAFPLHVEDEEELIRLLSRTDDEQIWAACSLVLREHRDQEHLVAALVVACRRVMSAPERLEERHALTACVDTLEAELNSHLAEEERLLFPALRQALSTAELDAARLAMHERRTVTRGQEWRTPT